MTDRFAIYFVKKYVVKKKVKWQIILNPTRCIEVVSILFAVKIYVVEGETCSMRWSPFTGRLHLRTHHIASHREREREIRCRTMFRLLYRGGQGCCFGALVTKVAGKCPGSCFGAWERWHWNHDRAR